MSDFSEHARVSKDFAGDPGFRELLGPCCAHGARRLRISECALRKRRRGLHPTASLRQPSPFPNRLVGVPRHRAAVAAGPGPHARVGSAVTRPIDLHALRPGTPRGHRPEMELCTDQCARAHHRPGARRASTGSGRASSPGPPHLFPGAGDRCRGTPAARRRMERHR